MDGWMGSRIFIKWRRGLNDPDDRETLLKSWPIKQIYNHTIWACLYIYILSVLLLFSKTDVEIGRQTDRHTDRSYISLLYKNFIIIVAELMELLYMDVRMRARMQTCMYNRTRIRTSMLAYIYRKGEKYVLHAYLYATILTYALGRPRQMDGIVCVLEWVGLKVKAVFDKSALCNGKTNESLQWMNGPRAVVSSQLCAFIELRGKRIRYNAVSHRP